MSKNQVSKQLCSSPSKKERDSFYVSAHHARQRIINGDSLLVTTVSKSKFDVDVYYSLSGTHKTSVVVRPKTGKKK